ncbi:hypothetical protein NIK97_17860 [Brucella pseudintermedia]|uniref:Uncharacterized protein n=1 Tax=Brucella pseudintermedia TaxID=370111 RepID=A0ABY5UEJ2_9HYPH|nr:hypothetical protein [Brucella pseudintermedia]UWL61748.1 hypothetical protein NIK97_17860 [Brucella pseudintermedia]
MKLSDIFRRQPPENRLLIDAIAEFNRNYPKSTVWDGAVITTVIKEVTTGIKTDSSFATDLIVKGGWPVADAAAMLISEFAATALQSGHLHIYRGKLNDQGHAYMRLFKYCVAVLMKHGRLSEGEAVERIREIEDEVQAVG